MLTGDRRPLQPLTLSALASSVRPPPHAVFRGRITAIRAYSPHSRLSSLILASLDPADPVGTALEVEFKGEIAFRAARRLRKGDVLILATRAASLIPVRRHKSNGQHQGTASRVRFHTEVMGWIRRQNGDEEFLHYQDPSKRGREARSLVASACSTREQLDSSPHVDDRADLPTSKRPRSPTPPRSVGKKIGPPEQGTRSRKRRKIVPDKSPTTNPTEKLATWDFDAPNGTRYTPLHQLGALVAKTRRMDLQSTQINIVAVVTDSGTIYEPRTEGRDWYRSFRVIDPTCTAPPAEVQWYAKAQAGLPNLENGDVFLARSLVLKSTSTVAAPILLAKSFTVVSHVALRPEQLLATPAVQHPSPPEDNEPPPSTSCERSILRLSAEELEHAARVWKESKVAQSRAKTNISSGKTDDFGCVASDTGPEQSGDNEKLQRTKLGGSSTIRPLLRIEEIVEGKFCDLVGMVTKLHCSEPLESVRSSCAASLYVTDYTPHPLLYDYDSPAAVGLPGQLVLQVSIFGAQARSLPALIDARTGDARRGALVHLRNVRIKSGAGGALEGTLWEDRDERYRDRLGVTVVDLRKREQEERWGTAAREVQRRHREYWAARSKEGSRKT